MELGATVCLPNGAPLCDLCPARAFCTARLTGRTGQLPVKAAKKARRVEERTVFLIFHETGWPRRRRPGRGLLAGLWEYPNELSPAGGRPGPLGHCSRLPPERWDGEAYLHPHRVAHVRPGGGGGLPALPEGWVWADRAALAGNTPSPNAFQPFQGAVEERLGHF